MRLHFKMEIKISCGNSNMRNLTTKDRENGRSHRCSEKDICESCVHYWGLVKIKEFREARKR